MGTKFVLILSSVLLMHSISTALKWNYKHDNVEIFNELRKVNRRCPKITRIYYLKYGNIDKTVLGHKLYVIVFGKYPEKHVKGIPEYGVISNLHGNEIIGREIVLHLADIYCTKYLKGDRDIVNRVDSMRLHMLASYNPDGYELRTDVFGYGEGHNNYYYQDLNHDFPDLGTAFFKKMEHLKHNVSDHMFNRTLFQKKKYQRETLMLMNWIGSLPFVLQINLHSATITFNYGYQQSVDVFKHTYNPTPDDDMYRVWAFGFFDRHAEMTNWRVRCPTYWIFQPYAIQKGSTWLSVKNGWHDWSYLSTNMMGNNVFLSCQRNMLATNVKFHFWTSYEPIQYHLIQVHLGIKGMVWNEKREGIADAVIKPVNVTNADFPYVMERFIHSTPMGDYYRMLLPGSYAIMVDKRPDYQPAIKCVRVTNNRKYEAKRLDFVLSKTHEKLDKNCEGMDVRRSTIDEMLSLKV